MTADEEHNLQQLLALLNGLDTWLPLTGEPSNAWNIQDGSALAGDDAKTHPYEVSHSAWHALTVAVDHLHCLRSSLRGELRGETFSIHIHTHAQSSLIRGAFENSARAVWLLGPAARLTRVTRRLSLELKELRTSYHLRELVNAPATRAKAVRTQQLMNLATAAGVPATEVAKALKAPGYGEIVRGAGDLTPLGANAAEVIWSSCSSLAHGDISGTLGLLEREIHTKAQDVAVARVTGSAGGLYWTTFGTVSMVSHGFQLYKDRATRFYQ